MHNKQGLQALGVCTHCAGAFCIVSDAMRILRGNGPRVWMGWDSDMTATVTALPRPAMIVPVPVAPAAPAQPIVLRTAATLPFLHANTSMQYMMPCQLNLASAHLQQVARMTKRGAHTLLRPTQVDMRLCLWNNTRREVHVQFPGINASHSVYESSTLCNPSTSECDVQGLAPHVPGQRTLSASKLMLLRLQHSPALSVNVPHISMPFEHSYCEAGSAHLFMPVCWTSVFTGLVLVRILHEQPVVC